MNGRNLKAKLFKSGRLYDDNVVCDIEISERSPGGWIEASKPLVEGDKTGLLLGGREEEYTLVLDRAIRGMRTFKIKVSLVEPGKKSGAFEIISLKQPF